MCQIHRFWQVIACFAFAGCASFATTLRPADIGAGEGAFFGRVQVLDHNEDITARCSVDLVYDLGHSDHDVDLDESGWVFSTIPRGAATLGEVSCDIGRTASRRMRGVWFTVAGDGTLSYFGHLTVQIDSEDPVLTGTQEIVAEVRLPRGHTTVLTLNIPQYTLVDIDNGNSWLEDRFAEAKQEYRRRCKCNAERSPVGRALRPLQAFIGAKPPSSAAQPTQRLAGGAAR